MVNYAKTHFETEGYKQTARLFIATRRISSDNERKEIYEKR